jgi:hypothetical protein
MTLTKINHVLPPYPQPPKAVLTLPKVAIETQPSLLTAADNDKRFQFHKGSHAYVKGWNQKENVLIIERLLHLSESGIEAPHYRARDSNGQDWYLSQLILSHKPIVNR